MSFTESGAKRKREGEWEGGSWTLKLGLIDWSFEREKKSQKIERIFKISALVRFGHASFCGSAADSASLSPIGRRGGKQADDVFLASTRPRRLSVCRGKDFFIGRAWYADLGLCSFGLVLIWQSWESACQGQGKSSRDLRS